MATTKSQSRPALTVDCVVFGLDEHELKLLLIESCPSAIERCETSATTWSLPSGAVRIDETLDDSARRHLLEATGIGRVYLEQLYTFGELQRDPRERTVSVAYYALLKLADQPISEAKHAPRAAWFSVRSCPKLVLDHDRIIEVALARLQGKLRYQPIGFELLPPKFTLSQIQRLYETVLERPLDKRNFRKKILGMGLLTELDEVQRDVAHRAARLYRFDKAKYRSLEKQGLTFEL